MAFNSLKSLFPALATAALLAGGSGCFSLQRGVIRSTGQEHLHVANFGWYLFHSIPLACGNASKDAWTPWVMFRNDVTMEKVQERFMDSAGDPAFAIGDLTYTTNESVMLNIPGINVPLPIPYLLTYREIQLSGTLTRKPPSPKPTAKGGRR